MRIKCPVRVPSRWCLLCMYMHLYMCLSYARQRQILGGERAAVVSPQVFASARSAPLFQRHRHKTRHCYTLDCTCQYLSGPEQVNEGAQIHSGQEGADVWGAASSAANSALFPAGAQSAAFRTCTSGLLTFWKFTLSSYPNYPDPSWEQLSSNVSKVQGPARGNSAPCRP